MFDPGAARDGVTVHVPLTVLPQLKPLGFDWLVPALREELVTALIRSLPKEYRRSLVPVPEVVAAVLARVTPRSEPLLDALERELEALRGVRIPRAAWDLGRLPPHLRMTFRVEDDRGALVAEGDDLDALREQVRPRLRERLSAAASPLERHGMTRWEAGDLPKAVALPGTGGSVRGYPALVDEGATVGVRVLETPGRPARGDARRHAQAARARHALPDPPPPGPPERGGRARPGARAGRQPARRAGGRDGRRARVADGGGRRPGLGRGRASRGCARTSPAGWWSGRRRSSGRWCGSSTRRATSSAGSSRSRAAPRFAEARDDVARQLERLVHPGFVAETGAARLDDVERYLRAAARRLERLPDAPGPDRDKLHGVQELEREYAARRRRAGPTAGRSRPRCATSRGSSRSCAWRTSPRASACAGRCRRSGSGARSARPCPA